MKKLFCLVMLASSLSVNSALAQNKADSTKEWFAIHPKIGYGLNYHQQNSALFEDINCAANYHDANGSGMHFQLGVEFNIGKRFDAGLAVGFFDRTATFEDYIDYPFRDTKTQGITYASVKSSLEAKVKYLEFQPDVRYALIPKVINGPLRLVGAFRLAVPVGKSYEQFEEISSPAGAVFTDFAGNKLTKRTISAGDFQDMSAVNAGISFGVDHLLKIGKNLHLTQEMMFDFSWISISKKTEWTTSGLRFAMGLRYGINEPMKAPEPAPAPPPVEKTPEILVEKPAPVPVIKLDYAGFEGSYLTGNALLATSPIVNAVFFPANSSEIPAKYMNSTDNVQRQSDVEFHYHILAKVADIVKNNPKASVIIEGATSGADEAEGEALANKRAENIKSALVALGVPAKSITTKALISPKYPSNQDFEQGVIENRRADIIVKNAPLQEFVDIRKFAKIEGNAKVKVDFENPPAVLDAILSNSINSDKIRVQSLGEYKIPVELRTESLNEPFDLKAKLKFADKEKEIAVTIPTKDLPQKSIELDLSAFKAILRFDYNSSQLSEENKILIRQLVDKLPEGSTIHILGSADATGSDAGNLILSKERATSTEQFIRSISGNKFKFETGVSERVYSDETPQGRFLNRSIQLKVK